MSESPPQSLTPSARPGPDPVTIVDLRGPWPKRRMPAAAELPAASRLVLVGTSDACAAHRPVPAPLLAGRPHPSVLFVLVEPPTALAAGHEPARDDQHDLDTRYDPDLYTFLEADPDEPIARTGGTPAHDSTPAGTPRAANAGPTADLDLRPPSDQWPAPGPARHDPDHSPPHRPAHDPTDGYDPLLMMLDVLREPEAFDRVHRAVGAVAGGLVLPGIGAVVHQLPERSRHDPPPRTVGRPGLARRAPRDRLGRLYPLLPARIRRFAPLAAVRADSHGDADSPCGTGPAPGTTDDRPGDTPTGWH